MSIFSALLFVVSLYLFAKGQIKVNTPLSLPVYIFTLTIAINLLLTPQQAPWPDRLEELVWIFNLWSLSQVLTLTWNEKIEKNVLFYLSAGVIIASSYGLFQSLTGIDLLRGTNHLVTNGFLSRATGFFSNALTYGYCIGAAGLSIVLPLFQRSKPLASIVFVASTIAVLFSQGRGAWVGFFISCIILLFTLRKQLSKTQLLVGAGAALTIFSITLTQQNLYGRISQMINYKADESISIRFDLWKAHWQMFLDHPFFGVGFQQARDLLSTYYSKLGIQQEFISHAHNDYVQMLAETGFTGFTAFLFLIFYTMKKTYDLRHYKPEWAISLFAAQTFIFIGSLTQANFTDAEVNHILIFNWAIVSALYTQFKK